MPLDPKIIDDLAKRVSENMPAGIKSLGSDLEENFKAALQAGFSKLDLVTRDEFDVQAQVLRRTRQKLKALEARLDALENPAPAEALPDAKPSEDAD